MAIATRLDRALHTGIFHDLRVRLDAWLARRAAERRTFNELNALNDRELADLGLVRSDIGGIAHEAAQAR